MGWAGTPEAFRSSAGEVTGRMVRGTWERPGQLQAEGGCMEGGSSGS